MFILMYRGPPTQRRCQRRGRRIHSWWSRRRKQWSLPLPRQPPAPAPLPARERQKDALLPNTCCVTQRYAQCCTDAPRIKHRIGAVLSRAGSGFAHGLAFLRTCWVGLQMTGLLSFTTPSLRPVSIKDSKQMMPCASRHTQSCSRV